MSKFYEWYESLNSIPVEEKRNDNIHVVFNTPKKTMLLKEFVDAILDKRNAWGIITVKSDDKQIDCAYINGRLVTNFSKQEQFEFTEDDLNEEIVSIVQAIHSRVTCWTIIVKHRVYSQDNYKDTHEDLREKFVNTVKRVFGDISKFIDAIEKDDSMLYNVAVASDSIYNGDIYLINTKTGEYVTWYKLLHVGRYISMNFNPSRLESFLVEFKSSLGGE